MKGLMLVWVLEAARIAHSGNLRIGGVLGLEERGLNWQPKGILGVETSLFRRGKTFNLLKNIEKYLLSAEDYKKLP